MIFFLLITEVKKKDWAWVAVWAIKNDFGQFLGIIENVVCRNSLSLLKRQKYTMWNLRSSICTKNIENKTTVKFIKKCNISQCIKMNFSLNLKKFKLKIDERFDVYYKPRFFTLIKEQFDFIFKKWSSLILNLKIQIFWLLKNKPISSIKNNEEVQWEKVEQFDIYLKS